MVVITMGGPPGAGKSDVSKLLAKRLGLEYYSVGMFFREKAAEKNMDLTEYLKKCPQEVHLEADKHSGEVAKRGNIIIDGRLAAYMAKNAEFRIFLDAPLDVRGARVAKRNGTSAEEETRKIRERYDEVVKDIEEIYNIDIRDLGIYDIVLNTKLFDLNEVVDILEKVVRTGLKL